MAATNRTIALVTGANQGIGFATAKRLAAEHGYYVIMAGRRPDAIQSAAKSLIEQNLAVEGVVLDVKSNESIDTVFEHVQR
jgi:NAD(P)-dependent dehydrogenase (short-subunit alcohol dehydrogenase family)